MIEQHVTSLELSTRLKELGVPQESSLVWFKPDDVRRRDEMLGIYPAAFLASELGEMLPNDIERNGDHFSLRCEKAAGWTVGYPGTTSIRWHESDTESDARAKLLICLIEQGFVDPKKLSA